MEIIDEFAKLSIEEQIKFIQKAKAVNKNRREAEKLKKIKPCPFCKSKNINLNGHDLGGLQRFKCKRCKKTFSHRTGTVLHSLKKVDVFERYYELMLSGYMPLKEISKKLNVSMTAAFQWRHKILSILSQKTNIHEGLVNFDIISMKLSMKGYKNTDNKSHNQKILKNKLKQQKIKILLTADYEPNYSFSFSPLALNKIQAKHLTQTFIDNVKDRNTVWTAPENPEIHKLMMRAGLRQYFSLDDIKREDCLFAFDYTERVKGEFRDIIYNKMRGISSKYLWNYSGWMMSIAGEKRKPFTQRDISLSFKKDNIWHTYINIGNKFLNFLGNSNKLQPFFKTKTRWKSGLRYKILRKTKSEPAENTYKAY